MIEQEERRWVLLEDGYPLYTLLTKQEAEVQKQLEQMKYKHLQYSIIYDAYYEYTEITN